MHNNPRVLITGHKGYIGSVLAPVFMRAGYDVTGLDIGYFDECTLVPEAVSPPALHKDIRHLEPSDLKGYYAVVHLAALSNDPIGNLNRAWTDDINTKASVRLAELAREAGVRRFLFSSSCIMYGMASADVVNEESPVNPQTEYARSKVECERAISALARDGFSPVFLRNGTVYGLSPRMRFDTVFNDLVAQAFTTGKVIVYSDGKPWRPVVHVQDVARAFLAVLQAPEELVHNETYNNGSERLNYQVITLAEIAARTVPGARMSVVAESSADQRTYRTDFGKFARAFPEFEFQLTPESGARELYESFQRVGLDHSTFTDKRFTRLKWLRHLMETGRLDESLNWTGIPERELSLTA